LENVNRNSKNRRKTFTLRLNRGLFDGISIACLLSAKFSSGRGVAAGGAFVSEARIRALENGGLM
jgi:hypothetical protein